MRIAEISAFSQYSVGKIMNDIKRYIGQNTNDVCDIFYARGNIKKEKGYHFFGGNFSVRINAFLARLFDNDGFCKKRLTKKLIKQLNTFRPDIVHLHCLHGYYLNVKLLFDYLKEHQNIKVFWTMHDTWAFTGHCCYFGRAKCNRWKEGCYQCPLKKDYPASLLRDCSKSNYLKKKSIFASFPRDRLTIITPSKWLANLVSQSFLNLFDVKVIYNGVDTSVFNSVKVTTHFLPKNKKILLGVASVWDKRKGLNTFIELAPYIKDQWIIIIVGKINNRYVNLDQENIIHIERTNDQLELKALYQSANLLLNPTMDDNYPTVNIEAQACGCKVLTFDTGGSKETDCGNLYLASSFEPFSLKEEIEKVSSHLLNDIDINKIDRIRMGKEYHSMFEEYESTFN